MNMRRVTERAARVLLPAPPKDHVQETETAIVVDEAGVRDKTYRFFNEQMDKHAEAFKAAKKVINMTEAHASLRGAMLTAGQSATGGDLFFEIDNPVLVRIGLWSVINTTVGTRDAYPLVAQRYGGIKFAEGFEDTFGRCAPGARQASR